MRRRKKLRKRKNGGLPLKDVYMTVIEINTVNFMVIALNKNDSETLTLMHSWMFDKLIY